MHSYSFFMKNALNISARILSALLICTAISACSPQPGAAGKSFPSASSVGASGAFIPHSIMDYE